LPEQFQGLLAGLFAGELAKAPDGHAADFAVDTLFQDEGSGTAGEDAYPEAFELRITQNILLPGERKRGLIDDGFGDVDPLIVHVCRHYVDIFWESACKRHQALSGQNT
jgi:hypothetical protein